ncbi:MAG TPA: lycopene cyclase family protein [Anaerolineae bacterium]|nr:lycopene cyclase family protein [Anaerolineae bacterium]
MKHYDFIIVGGGAAGLSLACHLIDSPLRDRSILIVDQDAKDKNDRTWSFWTTRPTLFDSIVHRSWSRLHLAGENFEQIIDLGDYRYQMIRAIDFYRFARQALSAHPNVEFLQARVDQIEDDAAEARIITNGHAFAGSWAFDSRFKPSELKPDPTRYHTLNLHFRGWEIETPEPAFNPQVATFLDFRTPQKQDTRFFYVLPLSEQRALVEYTLFSSRLLRREEYERALGNYLWNVLQLGDYRVLGEEKGIIPITDQPFPRRTGRHVMTIGAKGGRIKPATGFAFLRIQQDSAAIVDSLLRTGQPFDIPADSARYRLYDSLMLHIMLRRGAQVQQLFTRLFKRNPIERVLRFLDEAGSVWENLQLIPTLPPAPFLEALLRVKVLRQMPPGSIDIRDARAA